MCISFDPFRRICPSCRCSCNNREDRREDRNRRDCRRNNCERRERDNRQRY